MGGRQYTQPGRRGRPGLRRAVLLTVFGMLAGALLLCVRSGESHVSAGAQARVQPGAQAGAKPGVQARAPGASAGVRAVQAHGPAHAVCVSPYHLPGCSSLAHVTPGVLPVPPPAVTVVGGGLPPSAPTSGPGRIRPPGPLARAPDLHALQVLRT
ncbi:hypothetical protein ACWGE1_21055 [Streptomyces sp. NPDC054932]